MESYRTTQSAISFHIDLTKLTHVHWIQLGEVQSLCQQLSSIPLQPEQAHDLDRHYLARGIMGTTALDGNTLSLNEVKARMAGQLELPTSQDYLGREIDSILRGCKEISKHNADVETEGITAHEIKVLNDIVIQAAPPPQRSLLDDFASDSHGVFQSDDPGKQNRDSILRKMCDWLNQENFTDPNNHIVFGTLRAILAHLYIAWRHPFTEGNGQTARLVELQILLASGVPPAAAHLPSNHYNVTRNEYYRQLEYATESEGDAVPFVGYAVQGFLDGLNHLLADITQQQVDLTWTDLVHKQFKDQYTAVNKRREMLTLEISNTDEPTPFNKLQYLSPKIAATYARRTDKTLQRDLNTLLRLGLIRKQPDGYEANRSQALSILPPHNPPPVPTNPIR